MDYISPYDQGKHDVIAQAISHERQIIAKHYRTLKQLQERLLKIGTEDEQIEKRLKLSVMVAQMDNNK